LSENTIDNLSVQEINHYLEAYLTLSRERASLVFAGYDYYLLKSASPTKPDGKPDISARNRMISQATALREAFCFKPKKQKKLSDREKLERLARAFPDRGVAKLKLDGLG
jgi:hypothetical protein